MRRFIAALDCGNSLPRKTADQSAELKRRSIAALQKASRQECLLYHLFVIKMGAGIPAMRFAPLSSGANLFNCLCKTVKFKVTI
jgi:hypothetical protein